MAQLQLLMLTAIWAVVVIARMLFHFLQTEREAEANCYMDYSEACGGPNRLSVYTSTGSVTALPVPTTQTTGLPGNWQYSKCFAYVHFRNSRCRSSLAISEPPGGRVFPLYEIFLTTNNSATNCLNLCSTFGYPAAGMEYSSQCCT